MRYLVQQTGREKQIFLWIADISHTSYATERKIDLNSVSSVGYAYFNPDENKWILTGAVSWTGKGNVTSDKRRVLAYLKKYLVNNKTFMMQMSDRWYRMQRENNRIIQQNSFLTKLVKKVLERE